MEQKKNNIFMSLLFNGLKAKRNWFFLSTVIMFITTLLIPYILELEGVDVEFFIFFGVFEAFALVFVNCLVDNSFLHNDSKLAYYKSKPLSFREQIAINIIINMAFAAFLLVLIILSVMFQRLNYEILDSFKVFVPWLLIGIFLAALSSILAGNTLVAGAMTLFNFALPGIIYLIIQFMFSILEDIVAGFSANVLMNYFVYKVYKLDYIYFAKYTDIPVDYIYFLMLGLILIAITLLIFKMLKRRKNENTGNFIVFDGYKYFVSVLASLILPAFFSAAHFSRNIVSEIIVSLLLAVLTYYLVTAVMEKSFKISKLSAKVFVLSMALFFAVTGGTVAFANQYRDVVPDAKDVKYAYVGSNTWVLRYINEYIEHEDDLDYEDMIRLKNRNGIILFTDKDNIQTIIDLHKEMLANPDYDYQHYWMNSMVIMYFMNDGSFIVRDYKINEDDISRNETKYETDEVDTSRNETKDNLATKLMNSQEFKEIKYYYLYDEKYYANKFNSISLFIGYDDSGKDIVSDVTFDEVYPYLIKDVEERNLKADGAFIALTNYNFEKPYMGGQSRNYLQIIIRNTKNPKKESEEESTETLFLDEGYENTKEYLEKRFPELTTVR